MTTTNYTCRLCGLHGQTQYDPACPNLDIAKWLPQLVCNSCHDFESKRRRIGRRIANLCVKLLTLRQCDPTAQELFQTEATIKARLTPLTRDYARLLADRYRRSEIWDEEFPAMLVEKPDRSWTILDHFRTLYVRSGTRQAA